MKTQVKNVTTPTMTTMTVVLVGLSVDYHTRYLCSSHVNRIRACLSRVCAVAEYAVLKANAKVSGKSENLHLHLTNPNSNLNAVSNISLRPARDSMCRVSFEQFQPLRLCACVKNAFQCGCFY